jgi:hypothetical protein
MGGSIEGRGSDTDGSEGPICRSDVTMALAKYVTNTRTIKEDTIHGMSGAVVFNQEGTLSIKVAGRTVEMPALVIGLHAEAFAATMSGIVGRISNHRIGS